MLIFQSCHAARYDQGTTDLTEQLRFTLTFAPSAMTFHDPTDLKRTRTGFVATDVIFTYKGFDVAEGGARSWELDWVQSKRHLKEADIGRTRVDGVVQDRGQINGLLVG